MQLSDRIVRRMKLQDLHVLMAVAQTGSMRKAAALLNTTQPSISRAIAELEDVVGVRLLDRIPRGVEPTEYGRALLNGGAAMFDELHQAVKNIEFLADPTAGTLRIGINPFLAVNFVPDVVDRISRRYPRMMFEVMEEQVETLHRELHARNVDLLVARKAASLADDRLDFEFLFEDSFVVAAGAQSQWARRRRIQLAQLVGEPWTLPTRGVVSSVATEAFRANGLAYPHVTMATVNREARMRLLATGRFLTIFATSSLRFPCLPEIKVLPIELPNSRMQIGIFTLRNRSLSRVAQLFLDAARTVAGQQRK